MDSKTAAMVLMALYSICFHAAHGARLAAPPVVAKGNAGLSAAPGCHNKLQVDFEKSYTSAFGLQMRLQQRRQAGTALALRRRRRRCWRPPSSRGCRWLNLHANG